MTYPVQAMAAAGYTKSQQSRAKLAEDMDKFMHLLVTQLKNQDPLNPMDSTEFTSQLVQFASVEQQIQSNANLEKLVDGQKETHLAAMIGYVGRQIEAKTDKLPLENGKARFSYVIPGKTKSSSIIIRDNSGKVVFSDSGRITAGKHYLDWDGRDKDGKQLDDGLYKVEVTARNETGQSLRADVTTVGEVKAVWINGGETQFELLNGAIVGIEGILNVREASYAGRQGDEKSTEKTEESSPDDGENDKTQTTETEKTSEKGADEDKDKDKEKT